MVEFPVEPSETAKKIIANTVADEGGYKSIVNNPVDPGGLTVAGITISAYMSYRGEKISTAEAKTILLALSEDTINDFYYIMFYIPIIKLTNLEENSPQLEQVYNAGVNIGIEGVTHIWNTLQGPTPKTFFAALIHHYIAICQKRQLSIVFLSGWFNRAWKYVQNAL